MIKQAFDDPLNDHFIHLQFSRHNFRLCLVAHIVLVKLIEGETLLPGHSYFHYPRMVSTTLFNHPLSTFLRRMLLSITASQQGNLEYIDCCSSASYVLQFRRQIQAKGKIYMLSSTYSDSHETSSQGSFLACDNGERSKQLTYMYLLMFGVAQICTSYSGWTSPITVDFP